MVDEHCLQWDCTVELDSSHQPMGRMQVAASQGAAVGGGHPAQSVVPLLQECSIVNRQVKHTRQNMTGPRELKLGCLLLGLGTDAP